MDTTSTTPTPPAPVGRATPAWWRRPLADLLDVAAVALGGLLVGGGVAVALGAAAGDDPWAGLGAVLLGLGAGLLAALAGWIGLLTIVARQHASPGSRALGLGATRPLPAAGRHLAVVVLLWAGLGTVAATTEPWPAGPLGGALGAAVATAAAVTAWGRGPRGVRLGVVGAAAVAGLLLAGAVPDRAPYPWEQRREAEAAVLAVLQDDPTAHRACDAAASGGVSGAADAGPLASHASRPCHDPDREWVVDRHPTVVAEQLAAITAEVVGAHASVRLVDVRAGREVRVDVIPVATVVPRRDACAALVVIGARTPPAPEEQADGTSCR